MHDAFELRSHVTFFSHIKTGSVHAGLFFVEMFDKRRNREIYPKIKSKCNFFVSSGLTIDDENKYATLHVFMNGQYDQGEL